MKKGLLAVPGVILVIIIAIIVANSSGNKGDRCIVTVYGKNYDVTELRGTHPGGDVYRCGTDMTSMYGSQHGTNLERLEPYLVP